MNQQNPMWNSISILVAAVLAIIAFVPDRWSGWLLLAAFAVWGAWAVMTQLLPALRRRRDRQPQSRMVWPKISPRTRQESRRADTERYEQPSSEIAQTLLRHINRRISGQLKAMYPNVRWEWKTPDPTHLAIRGGIGRIRVYGIPDYDYADVELDPGGALSCSLVSTISDQSGEQTQPAEPHKRKMADPQVWFEREGKAVLKAMVSDLDSRGHNRLTIREDGTVFVEPVDGGEETKEGVLHNFPIKDCWPKLVTVLEQAGFAAAAREDSVAVVW